MPKLIISLEAKADLDDIWDYIIFYQMGSNTVEILHIFHGKRDYPKLFGYPPSL